MILHPAARAFNNWGCVCRKWSIPIDADGPRSHPSVWRPEISLHTPFAEQDQALLVIINARVRDVGVACDNCVISVLVEQWRVAWQGQRVTLGTEQSSFCHQACIHRVPRRSSASSSPNHCLSRALRRRLHLSPPITNKELFFSSRVSKRYLSGKSLFHVNNCAAFLWHQSLTPC